MAASRKSGSFNIVKAWSGVFDRDLPREALVRHEAVLDRDASGPRREKLPHQERVVSLGKGAHDQVGLESLDDLAEVLDGTETKTREARFEGRRW